MKLPADLEVLARAEIAALGPVGYAARVPPEYEAFNAVEERAGDHLDELEWMLEHATPAGKWYAAALIAVADDDRGKAAWRELLGDKARFTYAPGGCSMVEMSLDEAARSALGDDPDLVIAPPRGTGEGPGMLLVIVPAVIFAAAILWLILR